MAQVIIRNVDDDAILRLKDRARRKGVSLESELRTIVVEASRADHATFRARAAECRERLAGRRHSDSTDLVREDRER
jgi:antitoxin FitA